MKQRTHLLTLCITIYIIIISSVGHFAYAEEPNGLPSHTTEDERGDETSSPQAFTTGVQNPVKPINKRAVEDDIQVYGEGDVIPFAFPDTLNPVDLAHYLVVSLTDTTSSLSNLVTAGMMGLRDTRYLPILMYHYVRNVDEEEDPLGYNLSITPALFEQHLQWFRDNNVATLRMDTVAKCLRGLERCPNRAVALTFDDGYEDAATQAYPLLKKYGFTATFYIVTELVGRPGYMTWEQVQMLHDNGMEIGSHTMQHFDLPACEPEVAYDEIVQSRKILEEKLGAPVVSFSYPVGSYNEDIANMVYEAGYSNAVTTVPSTNQEYLYEIPRQRIMGGETSEALTYYIPLPEAPTPNTIAQLSSAAGDVLATNIIGIVTEDYVQVREGPGVDYATIVPQRLLEQRDWVEVLGNAEGGKQCPSWFEVRMSDNTTGWVCAAFVQVTE